MWARLASASAASGSTYSPGTSGQEEVDEFLCVEDVGVPSQPNELHPFPVPKGLGGWSRNGDTEEYGGIQKFTIVLSKQRARGVDVSWGGGPREGP